MAAAGPAAIRRALARFTPRPPPSFRPPSAEAADVRAVRTFQFHYALIQWLLLFAFFLADLVAASTANLLFVITASVTFVILSAAFLLGDDLEFAFGNTKVEEGGEEDKALDVGGGEGGR